MSEYNIIPSECPPDRIYMGTLFGERVAMHRCDPGSRYPWKTLEGDIKFYWASDWSVSDLVPMGELRDNASGGESEARLAAVRRADSAERERDEALRRAESAERERDEAQMERTDALDERDAVQEAFERRSDWLETCQREHDKTRDECTHWRRLANRLVAGRDEWKARAETAEERLLKGTTNANDSEEYLDVVNAALSQKGGETLTEAEAEDDPVVFSIHESDIESLKVSRNVYGERATEFDYYTGYTPEGARKEIASYLRMIASREAIARSIEAERKARP